MGFRAGFGRTAGTLREDCEKTGRPHDGALGTEQGEGGACPSVGWWHSRAQQALLPSPWVLPFFTRPWPLSGPALHMPPPQVPAGELTLSEELLELDMGEWEGGVRRLEAQLRQRCHHGWLQRCCVAARCRPREAAALPDGLVEAHCACSSLSPESSDFEFAAPIVSLVRSEHYCAENLAVIARDPWRFAPPGGESQKQARGNLNVCRRCGGRERWLVAVLGLPWRAR